MAKGIVLSYVAQLPCLIIENVEHAYILDICWLGVTGGLLHVDIRGRYHRTIHGWVQPAICQNGGTQCECLQRERWRHAKVLFLFEI